LVPADAESCRSSLVLVASCSSKPNTVVAGESTNSRRRHSARGWLLIVR
jgi:hypothetical protein